MRVLYVIDDGINRSGEEVTLKNWVPTFNTLHERGIYLDVVSLRGTSLRDAIKALDGELTTLASLTRVPIHRLMRLRQLMYATHYSLVHANEVVPSLMAGLARCGKARPPVVFHRHHERSRGPHRVLSRAAARLSDVTFTESLAVAEAAHELDRSRDERICQIPHGIPPVRAVSDDEIAHLRVGLSIPAAALVITAVARLRPEKGLDALITAANRAASTLSRPLHLIIVGDGPEESRLRRQLTEKNDVVTHMVGHDADVARWYALADVVAVPSLSEPFGLVVIEAMASRRPVIASRVGGPAEIVVDGTTGLLVPPGDTRALAEGITELEDRQLATRMGAAGYERYREMYSLDSMVDGWLAAYERLLAPR